MNVLVINCGSSSLKYQLINSDTEQVAAKGLCERIGVDGRMVYQPAGGEKEITDFIKAGKDVEIHCDFCDTDYVFNPDELTEILKKSRALKK